MRRTMTELAVCSFAFGIASLGSTEARAGSLADCGNINVEANASCVAQVDAECEASCTPVHFEAQCAANLTAECSGECQLDASIDCEADCVASCQELQCSGGFDCSAVCEADANATCSAQCSSSANQSECEASCKATFSAHCSAECEASPPECSGGCEASCKGSCEAEANLDCQVNCQASGYVECEANLEGGCKIQCEEPEGALFCDGQYVDHGGNAESCIDALEAIGASVDVSATGSASGECDDSGCHGEAEGKASVSCAAVPTDPSSNAWVLGVLSGLGVALTRRRRRH